MIEPNVLKNTLASPTDEGLYSLKALALSTGDYEKNKPVDFLRSASTANYIAEQNVCNSHVLLRTTQGRFSYLVICAIILHVP